MIVNINGEKMEIGAGLTVSELLGELGIRPGRVVVELNRNVLSRETHGNTNLEEGDQIEIVHFVGGG